MNGELYISPNFANSNVKKSALNYAEKNIFFFNIKNIEPEFVKIKLVIYNKHLHIRFVINSQTQLIII